MERLAVEAPRPSGRSDSRWGTIIRNHGLYAGILLLMSIQQFVLLFMLSRWVGWLGWKALAFAGASALGSVVLTYSWVRLLRGRLQVAGYWLVTLLLTLVTYADIVYYRQFGDLTSIASLRFAGQLGTVRDSLTGLMHPVDFALWIPAVLLLGLLLLPSRRVQVWAQPMKGRYMIAACVTGVLLSTSILVTVPTLPKTFRTGGNVRTAAYVGMPNYHFVDAGMYLYHRLGTGSPSPVVIGQVQSWLDNKRNPGLNSDSPLHGVAKGKNVIVLQVESLQAFPLGLHLDGQEVTPNLNRLAEESIHFTNFYHQTGQGVTADADLLANCSLLPLRTGAVYYDYASNNFDCMPTLLRRAGYTAVAMQGIRPDFWNLSTVYPKVGFQQFYSAKDLDTREQLGIGISDESLLRQAIVKLKAQPQPYYAFVVTLTSHTPFDFPGIPHELNLGNLQGTKTGSYLDAVHYTDKAVGEFVDGLKQEGLLDQAVLVLYGDHTGILRDVPGFKDVTHLRAEEELAWVQAEKRIPLLIRLPNGTGARKIDDAAGELDIAPTLAGLLGVDARRTTFLGWDLLGPTRRAVAFYDGSAVDANYLYLASSGKCFDARSGQAVAPASCDGIRTDASKQLEISSDIIQHDLVPKLTGN